MAASSLSETDTMPGLSTGHRQLSSACEGRLSRYRLFRPCRNVEVEGELPRPRAPVFAHVLKATETNPRVVAHVHGLTLAGLPARVSNFVEDLTEVYRRVFHQPDPYQLGEIGVGVRAIP